ncbi:MAG: hypothetical protein ACFFD4_15465 [Candidatus Odinarchaeota archaeon]
MSNGYISPLHLLITYLSASGGESSPANLHEDIHSVVQALKQMNYDTSRIRFRKSGKISPSILSEISFLKSRMLLELDKKDLTYRFTELIRDSWNKENLAEFFKLINKSEMSKLLLALCEEIIRKRESPYNIDGKKYQEIAMSTR